jgi:hypothetical protein
LSNCYEEPRGSDNHWLGYHSSTACHRSASDDETPDTSTYRPLADAGDQFEQKLEVVRRALLHVWLFREKMKRNLLEDREVLHTTPKVVDWIGRMMTRRILPAQTFRSKQKPRSAAEAI